MKPFRETDPLCNENRRDFLRAAGAMGLLLMTPACLAEMANVIPPINTAPVSVPREEKPAPSQKTTKQTADGIGDMMSRAREPDDRSESAVGDYLALEGLRRYGLPAEDETFQKYVNLVGNAVARNSNRPNTPLHFVVVQSPLYHSFSCPGGVIFLTTAFVKAMRDESQLAGVLAHEIAHVKSRHAVQSMQAAKSDANAASVKERKSGKTSAAPVKVQKKSGTSASAKAKKGDSFQEMVSSLQTVLFDEGLDRNMELDADLSGMEAAYRTGYDPAGLMNVLKILQIKERTAQKKGSWFSTHPPLGLRLLRCGERLKSYPDASALATVKNRFISYQKRL